MVNKNENLKVTKSYAKHRMSRKQIRLVIDGGGEIEEQLTIFIFLIDGKIRLVSDVFLTNISWIAVPKNSFAAPIAASPA